MFKKRLPHSFYGVEVAVGVKVGVLVGVKVGVFVGVKVGEGVKVAVGVCVKVAVGIGVDVEVGGIVPNRVICGANHRTLSWLGEPLAVTSRMNLTLFPAKGLRSMSTGKYLPS